MKKLFFGILVLSNFSYASELSTYLHHGEAESFYDASSQVPERITIPEGYYAFGEDKEYLQKTINPNLSCYKRAELLNGFKGNEFFNGVYTGNHFCKITFNVE